MTTKLLTPKQKLALRQSTARINIAHGSVRSGKTVGLELWRWMQFIRQAPTGAGLLMSGRTLKALERNTLRPMQELWGQRLVQFSINSKVATIAGRRVELEGANDEQAQAKIQGMTLYGAMCNELSLFPESFFRQLLARLSMPNAKLFATSNPDSPHHWLKTDFLEREGELNLRQWHFTLEDNFFLDEAYIQSLKAEYSGVWYKRMILGLWVMAEGAIYDMFDEKLHVSDAYECGDTFWLAIDYGTSNAFSASLFTKDKGKTVLCDEWYYDSVEKGRQLTDSEYCSRLIEFISNRKVEVIYLDPSALSFYTECIQRGLPVAHADNSVLDGIRYCASELGKGNIIIDPKCKQHIKGFESYVWDHKAQKLGIDKPLKKDDHAADSFRYGVYTHSKKQSLIW